MNDLNNQQSYTILVCSKIVTLTSPVTLKPNFVQYQIRGHYMRVWKMRVGFALKPSRELCHSVATRQLQHVFLACCSIFGPICMACSSYQTYTLAVLITSELTTMTSPIRPFTKGQNLGIFI